MMISRRFLGLILFGLAVTAQAAEPPAGPAQQHLALDALDPAREQVGELRFLGAVVVPMDARKIGGLSALMAKGDASHVLAVADNARLYEGTLRWQRGRLVGADFSLVRRLKDEDGSLPSSRARYDSESLARLPDGSWLVGYERDHRIEQYDDQNGPEGAARLWPQPPGLADLPRNEGLEALAAWPDGQIVAIAETVNSGVSPAWLWRGAVGWQSFSYRPAEGLTVSDTAVLPDGDLLVLERGVSLFTGFSARLARVSRQDLAAGRVIEGAELARLSYPVLSENFEGIAVLPGSGPTVRLLLVSDNNLNRIQQTILAAFEIKAAGKPAP